MTFSQMASDLQAALARDLAQIRFMLKKNPAMGYTRIVEVGREVGRRYGVKLIVNFPKEGRIDEHAMYGRRDLSIIIDQERRRFPVDRQVIKDRAAELIPGSSTEDAYMYEDKEGVRVLGGGWKIDVLPHSLHVWTEFDGGVTAFCDWLFDAVYGVRGP